MSCADPDVVIDRPARYYYAYRSDDDLAMLLLDTRSRRAHNKLMRARIEKDTASRMDTGIRVNRALASAMGVHVQEAAEEEPPSERIDLRDACMLRGQLMTPAEEAEHGVILVEVVL
jgi:pyrroloquinoline quinone (PQQ) biosynthesis protein C